jgi:hypothetical protein
MDHLGQLRMLPLPLREGWRGRLLWFRMDLHTTPRLGGCDIIIIEVGRAR